MRDRITKMDAEIEAYRTVLRDQPITAPEIGKWMAETVQDKRRLENLLGVEPTTKLTVDDVKAMVAGLRDITRSLALADPKLKAAAYAELGVTVTYHQEGRALLESRPQPSDVAEVRVGGGTCQSARRDSAHSNGVAGGVVPCRRAVRSTSVWSQCGAWLCSAIDQARSVCLP